MSNTLLMVMNPREIPECMMLIDRLLVDRVYMRGFLEKELEPVVAAIVDQTGYDYYSIVSDDAFIPLQAWNAVEAGVRHYDAYTGWCTMKGDVRITNLMFTPLPGVVPPNSLKALPYATVEDVYHHKEEEFRTYLNGFCITSMTRDLWKQFPFKCYPSVVKGINIGRSSDYHLSWRLQDAGIPMMTGKASLCWHLKESPSLRDYRDGTPEVIWKRAQ